MGMSGIGLSNDQETETFEDKWKRTDPPYFPDSVKEVSSPLNFLAEGKPPVESEGHRDYRREDGRECLAEE